MKNFLKKLTIFSIPVFVLLITMEVLLRKIPNDYAYKKSYLDKNAKDIEVLFLGNSHIFYGINPEFINANSFNAASIAQSLDYDLAILKKYKNDFKSLNQIVIPIDYFTLFTNLENGSEKWRAKNYSIYFDINNDYNPFNNYESLTFKLPTNFDRLKKYYKRNITERYCSTLGFGTNYTAAITPNLPKTAKDALRRYKANLVDNPLIDENRKILKEILEIAANLKAKVLLVTCPAHVSFYNNVDIQQLNVMTREIETITQHNTTQHNTTQHNTTQHNTKFNSPTSYLNLLKDTSFTATDFYDADHLNTEGAKKFSKKLNEVLALSK